MTAVGMRDVGTGHRITGDDMREARCERLVGIGNDSHTGGGTGIDTAGTGNGTGPETRLGGSFRR